MADGNRVILRNVIGSFMAILEPKAFTTDDGSPGEAKYSLQVVMPKDHPQLADLKARIVALAKEKFPKVPPAKLKMGLRDADAEGSEDPNMAGMMFFNASAKAKFKPQVINRGGVPLTSEDDIYSGCLINVSVNLFTYDRAGNKGIGFGLGNVQLVEKRESWSGRRSAADEFGVDNEFSEPVAQGVEASASDEDDSSPWD